ncbi:hypothetical protein X801_06804 [Opisthorchis viverrini]|uniref:Uncharacterized protein n=2 Tax=Opisthorchis viverrini TaxID=6198 RepID=A0A1S8WSE8_OPIVI|nr:hypothetical protein T265_04096 [Opisthorchis viverrini]KER29250.1 hypothetical protein T265_04096 [Opisthorchis viverrini]OON17358.1 hypothetical protein X801_06804 [Opisthorchis viverrini]
MYNRNRTPNAHYNCTPNERFPSRLSLTSTPTEQYPNYLLSPYGSPSFDPGTRSTPAFHQSLRFVGSPRPPAAASFNAPPAHFMPYPCASPVDQSSGYPSIYNSPMCPPSFRSNYSQNSIATPSYMSAREQLNNSMDATPSSFRGGRSSFLSSRHDRSTSSPHVGWITRALSDPWADIIPKQAPETGYCLVSRPLAQRHTVLFAPRQLRRKAGEEPVDETSLDPKRMSLEEFDGVIDGDSLPCFSELTNSNAE